MKRHNVLTPRIVTISAALFAVVIATGCTKSNSSATLGISEGMDSDTAYTFVPVYQKLPYNPNNADAKNYGIQFAFDLVEEMPQFAYVECNTNDAMSANGWVVKLEADALIGIDGGEARVYVDENRQLFSGIPDLSDTRRPRAVKTQSLYSTCSVMPQRFISTPMATALFDVLSKKRALTKDSLAAAQFFYLALRGYEQADGRGLTPLQQAFIKVAVAHDPRRSANEIFKQLEDLDQDLNPCAKVAPSAKYSGEQSGWRNQNFSCINVTRDGGIKGYAPLGNFDQLRLKVLEKIALYHKAAYGDVSKAPPLDQFWAALTYSDDLNSLAASDLPEAQAARLLLGKSSTLRWSDFKNDTYGSNVDVEAIEDAAGFGLTLGTRNAGQRAGATRNAAGGCAASIPQQRGAIPGNTRGAGNTTLTAAQLQEALRGFGTVGSAGIPAPSSGTRSATTRGGGASRVGVPENVSQIERAMQEAVRNAAAGNGGTTTRGQGSDNTNGLRIVGVQGTGANRAAVAEFNYGSSNAKAYAYQYPSGTVVTQVPVPAESGLGRTFSAGRDTATSNAQMYLVRDSATVYEGDSPRAGRVMFYDKDAREGQKITQAGMFFSSATVDSNNARTTSVTRMDAEVNREGSWQYRDTPENKEKALGAFNSALARDAESYKKIQTRITEINGDISKQQAILSNAAAPEADKTAATQQIEALTRTSGIHTRNLQTIRDNLNDNLKVLDQASGISVNTATGATPTIDAGNATGQVFSEELAAAQDIVKTINTPTPTTAAPATTTPAVATGQPATGQPATGQPATGQPATGQPATGQPATGQPAVAGQPATTTASNSPAVTSTPTLAPANATTPAAGTPAATGTPTATGQTATGTPATGTPATTAGAPTAQPSASAATAPATTLNPQVTPATVPQGQPNVLPTTQPNVLPTTQPNVPPSAQPAGTPVGATAFNAPYYNTQQTLGFDNNYFQNGLELAQQQPSAFTPSATSFVPTSTPDYSQNYVGYAPTTYDSFVSQPDVPANVGQPQQAGAETMMSLFDEAPSH